MKRFVGFLSLMVLLLNSVLMPLTYAQEYQDEILGAQVNNTVGDSSNVENVSETEGEKNEGAEDASQFPVIEENPQESEITPVDESQDEDQEIPSESTLSGGLEGSENTNQEGANGVGSGNDLDETLGSGAEENLNVQTGADQVDDTLSGALISEQLASSGDVVSPDAGSGNIEDLEEDSGILSSVVEAIEGIFNSIRYFFVKDNSEYIREYKQNGVKVISLKDPVNGETITIMDRNLGAEDNDISSEDSYGNYYQWGNNNGFEKVDGGNATSNLAVYSLKYEGIGYTRDNKFRVGSNDIWELDEEGRSNYDELWYLGEDEEIQGPCPEGYHVPSDKEWNKLVRVWTKIHTVDENEGGKTVRSVKGDSLKVSLEQAGTGDAEENTIEEENLAEVEELFMNELKLPKAGNYATNGERQEGLGIYWTRTPSDKSYQSEVFSIERYFGEDFDENLLNRANGNSVRCFLDTYEKEVVEYNKEEIVGEETFDDVTVSVYAGTGFFPEGTKLLISPIVQEQEISDIKDKISEEDDNIIEDSKIVAFDISFIYRGEEVQPLEGKVVKVTFDYSNNDELSEADKIDEQEVKVFHIDDKDDEGNKVEKGEEVVEDVTNKVESEENGIAVADAESFSVYVLVSSSSLLEPFTVTYNLNGGYWTEEGESSIGNKDITYEYDSTVTLVSGKKYYKPTSTYKTPSKAGNTCNGKKCMFKGWYTDIGGNNRWNGTVSSDMTVYAKWLPFDDLHVYFLVDHDNIIHETIMDRNLGATEIYSQDYSHQNVAARGDYFQWGNNYAFGTSIDGLEQTSKKVSTSIWEIGVPSKYYSSVFYTTDKDTWTVGDSKLLWGGDGDTASSIGEGTTYTGRQGPCPDGYHIPSAMSRRQLFNNWNLAYNYDYSSVMNISSNNNNPIIVGVRNGLGKDLLLPPAGRWGGKTLANTDKDLSYWASSHNESDGKTAYGFFVGQFGVQPRGVQSVGGGGDGESRARSIRCFKNPENESSYLSLSNIHLNGGEKGIISIIDGKIAALKEPSRGDDEFRGWYTTSGYDEGTKIGVGSGLQQGDRLYAKWCAEGLIDDGSQCVNGYTITFDTDGGTNVPSQNVDLGGTGTRPIDPTKDGYSFLGWYLTGSQTEFNFNDVLTSNITLYAKWSLVEYNIKYILNSGFVLETNPTTYTIESGDVTLNNPIRVGYDFLGWSGTNLPECSVENHSICSVSVNIQHGSTGNRVYEAIWDIEKHNLYFDSLGGSEVPTQRVIYGEAGTKPADPTKDGYSFDGWYYTGLQIEFDFNTPITSDITIYAKWSLVEYNIKYILNSGFVLETNPTTYTTESGDITLNNPTREWYVFEGWSGTNLPECSMEDTSTCSKTVTISHGSIGDRTYEAIWGYVKHDLNFDSLGGSQVQTQKVIHGRTGTKPEDPTRDGYTFVGWYLTGLQTEFDFTGTTITSDITVYAKWSLVDYFITYYLNGGTGLVNTGIYTKETETFTLNNPTKLNYDFIGWSGTNLSLCSVEDQTTCIKALTIEQGSTGDRVYEAIYDCAYGKKLDGTCNIVRGEDGLIDYTNWEYNDLEVDLSVTDPVKIVIMDRNLGAAISDLDSTDAFGFYYQWGNNYGFRNVGTIENVSDEQVDASAYGPGNYYVSDTFIKQSSLGWDNPSNNNLWGGAGDRLYVRGSGSDGDRQGPCPTGYHVPSILEWNKIYSLAEEWKKTEDSTIVCDGFLSKEHCVASKLKLPKAGNIKGDSGTFEAGGAPGETFGRYWSSSRFDDNRAYRYRVNVEWNIYQGRYDQDYYYFNSNGMSVRCFKNVSSKPIVYQLSGGVQTGYPTSTVVWWNDTAKTNLATPTRTGSEFKGWYLSSGYEEGTKVTTNMISDYSNNNTVTLYSKWECEEGYEESNNGNACVKNEYTVTYDSITNGGTKEQQNETVGYGENPTLLSYTGYKEGWIFIGWNTNSGATVGLTSNEITVTSDITLYAIYKKEAVNKDVTFYKNGNAGYIFSGVSYYVDEAFSGCVIPASYNNEVPGTGCLIDLTLPEIIASENTPVVSGWTLRADGGTKYNTGAHLSLFVEENDVVNFYAQTYAPEKLYIVNYSYGTGVVSKDVTTGGCVITGTVNGIAQSGSCEVTLPVIEEVQGYENGYWYKKGTQEYYLEKIELSEANNGIELEAIAKAKGGIQYVIKHYFQMLNDDLTGSTNRYEMIYTYTGAGTGDTQIDLSEEKLGIIPEGFYYWKGKINNVDISGDIVDLSGYNDEDYDEDTTINPDGSLVIKLFYKRELYTGVWKNGDTVVRTAYNLPYGILVNNYRPSDPSREETDQTGYVFNGWYDENDYELTGTTVLRDNTTYTARYDEVLRDYTITWKFMDANGVEQTETTTGYYGTMPSHASGANYQTDATGYTFAGWTPDVHSITGDETYTAVYDETLRSYSITWNYKDENGVDKTQTISVNYGTIPSHVSGANYQTTQTGYTFIGWSPVPYAVTGDETYTAIYDETLRDYTITWKFMDANGVEQTETITGYYGTMPSHASGVNYQTDATGYTFAGWTPEVHSIDGEETYTAIYDETLRDYQITWKYKNTYGIEETENTTGYYGTMPSHDDGVNYQTAQTGYIFVGWSPAIHSITGEETYRAVYDEILRDYTITWKFMDANGVEQTETITGYYGTMPSHASGANYQTDATGYTFAGWTPEVHSITGEETYRAVYDEELRSYIITFHSNGGSSVDAQTKAYGTIGDKPENPTRDGYDFNGWYSNSGLTIEYHFTEVIKGNVDLYAKWSPITYTITYEYNNGTGSNPETYQIVTPEFTLSNPTRIGYTFIGWSGTSLVGSGNKTVTISVGSTGNREYEANWKANKYQVTYKANGGEGEDVKNEATYDEHYEFLSNSFVRTGYSFVEWNTKADGSGSGFVEGFSGIWKTTTGVNLYAIWNENTYNVVYAGGEGAIGSKAGFTTGYTNTFVLADNEGSFIKTGYTFSGWTYDGKHYAAGTELSRLATENGATVSFTAEWNVVPYTITYEYNNGTGSNPGTYQVDTDSFTLNNPTRTGYTFIGWSGTELEGSDNTNVTIVIGSVGDREYEANWQANKYNVTYKANGGEGVDVVEEATYDAKYVFTGNKFTRIGYEFVEWNTKADGTGTGYAEGFSGIWKTVTGVNLFAQWIAETYTVTFDGNEGEVTGITDKDVIFDSAYGDLSTASRTGYTFTGWYTEAVAGEKVESDTIVATASNHTLYAHWDENSYNVVYEGGEGTEGIVTGATYRYTEPFNLAANNFTKRGYSFSGWRNGENHYVVGTELSRLATENGATVTFTAEWNSVPYSITYELDGGVFSGGVVNPTSYTIESGKITVKNPEKVGYIFLGWTGTDLSALTTKVVITGGSIGDRTYYANWQARDDIKITINHYLQDLDVDNNTVLDTYSISGTIEEEGTADSIVDISDYQQSIAGYSYGSGKVDGSVVSTTTVSPDGSRVIDLFYTRNSYSYTIITLEGSSTEGSSLDGNYYYGAKVILSGDSNNDCFVWSGWSVQGATLENNMKQTSFIMPANDVTANSLVREKTYNIVFNGNGEDSGIMSPLNGIRCTQEFTLPENSFVKTGYTFTGWTTIPNGVKEFDNKATIQTLTTGDNVTIEFIAIWDVNYYPIVWKDYDGDVLYEDEFPYMGNPEYHGETPSRDADEQYTYTFAGWTPEEHVVTGSQVYTAVYNETLNEYTVTWDVNGTKTMETYKYGETPNFTGSKHKDPDEQYEYSFAGWTPEISSVTGDITYTATYTATLRKFTVTWNNRNGQTLEVDTGVEYGTVPHYGGEIPTKPADAGHTYTFNGWIPELTGVTKDTTYVAKFSSDDNKYTITWLDEDDTILEIDTDVPYGTIPSYDKGTPVKTGDAQYSYTFSGWSPEVIPVEGDATYVATYTSEVNTYTITWKNSNGETLREDTGVAYGTTGDFGGIPTSGSTDEFDYEFIGWNPAVGAIHGDTTYTAVYKSNKRKYSVRFVNGETELQSGMVEYGVMPVYTGLTPVKTGDAQYSYNYIGWTPGISAVTGDITYEATFEEIVNMYNVTFVDDDGSSVIQPAQKYAYGTLRGNIAKPVNPDKPDNEQYTYEFVGWIPVVSKITGDVTFTATYSGTLRTYSVTWKNWNGDVLETDANVPYGETPSYDSAEPTKPATAQYRYEFKGWDPVVSPVHGIIIYTAQFDEVPMTYTITWKNGDTVLEVDTGVVYGSIPSYDGVIPTKASDSQYDYVFVGWNPSTGEVVSDQVYVADFDPIIRTYTVLWKNYDGTTLETDENVPYGSTPAYNGSTPIKNGNAQYSYTFKNWSPDIGPVHGNTEYTAIYDEIINKYVVAWDNYDGTELSSDEVEYGVLPQYTGPTPTRERTDKYSYTFSNSWFPTVTSVTTGATYTALFTSTVNEYTITWKDGDGNTLKTEQVAYDETPEYTGATPTKTADAQYTYSFNNTWSPEVQSVTGDMTYTAQFDSTVNKYTITWIDGDDQVLKTDQVAYGETPEYTGETPTKTPTQEHTYTFKGWSPAVTSVTGPATYKAVFDGDVNEYAITWLDGDGNILKMETLEYGQMPSYSGATPTKTADAQYTYTFNGSWSPAVVSVTTGATYTAQFSSTLNKYSIVWKDGDGNTLKTDQVAYGTTPVFAGSTPTKTATAQYSYTFNNTWSPAIVSVTTGATYTAQFSSTVNKYSIVWKDGDGNTLKTDQVAYGSTPKYSGVTPTKTATAQYSYTFNDTWSPEIEDVTTGATYTAQFTPVLNKYTIVWKDWNGTILKPAEELEYGTHPIYGLEDPTREGDAHYSYTFNGWNPAVQDVTGPQVYTATYLQTVNKYRIIFLNDDDSEITSKQVEYGTTVANYKPDDPIKEGYTFNGWNPNLVTVVTGATYKATYTINQYTLTPELGVGLERIEGGGTFDYGTEVIFTGYAKEGYHFEGGETVKAFTVTVGAHNATVRINAIANKYVVKFQPNEGGGTMQDQEFTYDLTGVLHANSFRRSGYTFTGWIDEFGNYYADQGKVYNLVTGGVVEFTALWKVGEDKPEPFEPTTAAGGGRKIVNEDKEQEHESADTQTGGTGDIDSGSQYETGDIIPGDGSWTQEEMDAYKYAYKYHITTLAPREAAMPDDYVIRGHMAKMVVNYAVNVLGWKLPEKLPKQCKWNDGVDAWESQEIKDYAEKACALGLMGIDMNYFQPNKYVTRAQFGTIFGRLLRGKLPSTPYYAAHLAGLKERGIMTQIDHPEDRIEIRKWAWLMFMRSEKYFNIKK